MCGISVVPKGTPEEGAADGGAHCADDGRLGNQDAP